MSRSFGREWAIESAGTGSERLRTSCRDVLSDWLAPSIAQQQLRDAYLDHLNDRVDAWSRSCVGLHLTASSLICSPTGQVLLMMHNKLGCWLQTGGHIEASDASLVAAALREASEESGLGGLAIDPAPLLLSRHEAPCGPVRPTFHLDVQFLVTSPDDRPAPGSDESAAVQWFSHQRLPQVDTSVHDLVVAARHRLAR